MHIVQLQKTTDNFITVHLLAIVGQHSKIAHLGDVGLYLA